MTYEEMRTVKFGDKKSWKDRKVIVSSFGDFSVCLTDSGKPFIVDGFIADIIAKKSWQIDSAGYVKTDIKINGIRSVLRLHDYVMSFYVDTKPEGAYVDHVNGCKYDDRRCNLRIVTPTENTKNVFLRENNTSGVNGVSKTKNGKWRAYITIDKRQMALGTYKDMDDAIKARHYAEENFGFRHTRSMEEYLSSFPDNRGKHSGRKVPQEESR